MISEKQALADQVVTSSAQGLITETDDKDLLNLCVKMSLRLFHQDNMKRFDK